MVGPIGWRPRRQTVAALVLILTTLAASPFRGLDVIAAEAQAQSREPQRFAVAIKQRRVPAASRLIRVSQGDAVEITVTTDEATELHLHGYDILLPLEPGTPGVFRFEAKIAGRFAIEAHGFGSPGAPRDARARREITLLYLEVLPR